MDGEPAIQLRDGTRLEVRPIEPADKAALVAAFDRLSPESRYRRFFSPLTQLSERDLAYLTEIDHSDHEALAAIEPGTGAIVGVGRYVRTEDPESAEASIVVVDDWQARGLGSALLAVLASHARDAGITRFIALVLAENRGALELFHGLAPDATRERTRDGHLELLIDLPEPGAMEGSLLERALREAARDVVTMNPWPVLRDAIRRSWNNRPGR